MYSPSTYTYARISERTPALSRRSETSIPLFHLIEHCEPREVPLTPVIINTIICPLSKFSPIRTFTISQPLKFFHHKLLINLTMPRKYFTLAVILSLSYLTYIAQIA